MVQYIVTYGTGRNTVYHNNSSKNGHKFYIKLKGYFKIKFDEKKKSSKANVILQSAHYYENRKFALEHYYNLVAKEFF